MAPFPASIRPLFDRVGGLAGKLSSRLAPLRASFAPAPERAVRTFAVTALLAVVAVAALALARSPPRAAAHAGPPRDASVKAVERAAAPMKFIGAKPRSDNCADQVWPYIEQRCLVRAAASPHSPAARADLAPSAPPPPENATPPAAQQRSSAHATTGAAPPGPIASSPAAAQQAGAPRVATARL